MSELKIGQIWKYEKENGYLLVKVVELLEDYIRVKALKDNNIQLIEEGEKRTINKEYFLVTHTKVTNNIRRV